MGSVWLAGPIWTLQMWNVFFVKESCSGHGRGRGKQGKTGGCPPPAGPASHPLSVIQALLSTWAVVRKWRPSPVKAQ